MAKWGYNPAGNPKFLPAEQMPPGHPVYEMGLTDPNTTPGGIPAGLNFTITRPATTNTPSTINTPDVTASTGINGGISTNGNTNLFQNLPGLSEADQAGIMSGLQGWANTYGIDMQDIPSIADDPGNAARAEATRLQNEIDTANALAEARARAAAEAEAQAIANAKAQAELDRINAANAAEAEVASGSYGINPANLIAQGNGNPEANNQNINAAIGNGVNGMANGSGFSYADVYGNWAGAGGTLAGAGGAGRFSPMFGEFSPQQQYSSIMSTELPNYYMPGYQQMASRQFQPTFGRFLLGGYGAGGTGTGTADQASAEQQRQNYMQTFGDWYSQQDRTAPTNVQGGWNLATQLAGMQPGSEGYYRAALSRDALPLAESLQNAEDVQAMALARYYGGATPQSSYAARQTERALGNLFGRFSNRQMQQGQTSPASFVSYLSEMSPSRFGAYA